MDCVKVKRLLSRYIDNELVDGNLVSQVEGHLKGCPDCKAEFNILTTVKNLVMQKERINVKEDFLERVKNNIKEDQAQIIIRVNWLPEAGDLARRLIPVPAIVAIAMFFLVLANVNGLNPIDEYIFADLSTEEVGVLSGYVDSTDLLTQVIF